MLVVLEELGGTGLVQEERVHSLDVVDADLGALRKTGPRVEEE